MADRQCVGPAIECVDELLTKSSEHCHKRHHRQKFRVVNFHRGLLHPVLRVSRLLRR